MSNSNNFCGSAAPTRVYFNILYSTNILLRKYSYIREGAN